MYQQVEQPWMQDQQPNPYARQAAIFHLKKFGIQFLLECGSGLGYYSQTIYQQTGIKPLGIDTSPTAVHKACTLFPHLQFQVDNVANLARYHAHEAILFAELTWYILPELACTILQMHPDYIYKPPNQLPIVSGCNPWW